MRFFKYLLCVLLVCITVFGCGSSAAFAVDSKSLDSTAVLQDLQGSTIAGKEFNLADFSYDENGKVKILSLSEFSFSYKAEFAGNYALYVYVYNPTGKEIRADKNSIQLASAFSGDKATDYTKYDLKICNYSTGAQDKLFYKFKVVDDGSIFERVYKDNTARRYYVSSVELNYTGTAEDFEVSNKWIYSGYAKGCGADETADSTLTCVTDDLETVRLDVSSTYYRYNNGVRFCTQIDSVYFGVSNKLLQKYGTLQKIHAEWLKSRTSNIVALTDRSAYAHFANYIGTDYTDTTNPCGYCLFTHGRLDKDGKTYDNWSYNLSLHDSYNRTDKLPYLFDASGTNGTVSSAEMKRYIQWYSDKFGNKTVADKYSADLFSSVDGKKTDVTIDANSKFDINGFTAGSNFMNWFYGLIGANVEFEDLKDIKPIYIVKDTDLQGDNADISKRLYVAEQDVDNLKATYYANNNQGKITVLFRFAISEYDSYELKIHKHGDLLVPGLASNVGYLAQETVYLDFDIIDLTFIKENVATVIPVVSNPIDVIGGIDPPPSSDSGIPWWVLLIIGLLVLVLLVLFVKPVAEVVLFVLKVLWAIVSAPFRLIIWLCKKIFKRGAQ